LTDDRVFIVIVITQNGCDFAPQLVLGGGGGSFAEERFGWEFHAISNRRHHSNVNGSTHAIAGADPSPEGEWVQVTGPESYAMGRRRVLSAIDA